MKADLTKNNDLTATLTLTLEYADYGPKLEDNLRNYSRKVNLKGFRAGKTPKRVLTKMYGKGLLEETLVSLLNEKLFGYLDEQQVKIIGSPILNRDETTVDLDMDAQKDYTYVFDLGLRPELNLVYGLEEEVKVDVPFVDTEKVEQSIIRYRRALGDAVPVTDGVVEEFDNVTLNLSKALPDGGLVESTFTVSAENKSEDWAKNILGRSVDHQFTADLEAFFGEDRAYIVNQILKAEEDPMPGEPLEFQIKITAIERPQTTELTGEQLEKATGMAMKDEAEFKNFLLEREEKQLANEIEAVKKLAIRARLTDANPIELPVSFLLKWYNEQREGAHVSEGTKDADRLVENTKWSMLLQTIADEKKIEVGEEDVRKQVINWVMQNGRYFQNSDMRDLIKRLYENEGFMAEMREEALEAAVFAVLLPEYTFAENKVDDETFNKSYHDLHHRLFHHDHDHDHDHDHHDHDHDHHHE
jgi:trigger factor